ncbi:MAG: hypothetical protein HY784_06815, partial [Chloroflexi bacterium]|nr:hypothetical protein [Chloroflexota bacterium]
MPSPAAPSNLQSPTSNLQSPISIAVPDTREALAWLSAAWHNFPARRLVMIGVTGTDGKTTTASLIHHILRTAGLRAGLISTVSAVIGDQTLDTGFHVTTPDAPAVQALLARTLAPARSAGAAGAGLTHCVLEATSHGLAQGRVSACEFDVAALTNITHEHLDYHRTFDDYRAAKARLFDFLADTCPKPGAPPPTAILNRDDRSYPYLSSRTAARQISYSLTPTGDLCAGNVTHAPGGLYFDVTGPGFAFRARTSLAGHFNIANCLAALGVTVCG